MVEEEPVIAEEDALDDEALGGESADEESGEVDKDSESSSDSENEDQAEDTN